MIKEIQKTVRKPISIYEDVQLTLYITDDGQEFNSYSAAQKHERDSQIERVSYEADICYQGNWYLLRNLEDGDHLFKEDTKEAYQEKIEKFTYPVWVFIERERGEQFIHTREEIKEQLEILINRIPS